MAIRRGLMSLSGKEARFRKDTNHLISKRLVEKATNTDGGIALEELKRIRERTRNMKGRPASSNLE
jgi:IS605 OrfB family transposase